MSKRYLIPLALILLLVLVACSGGQTVKTGETESSAVAVSTGETEEMMEEGHDDEMADMAEESHDDDMANMDEGGHDDDEAMMDDGHDDDMESLDDDAHDDNEAGGMDAEADGDMAGAALPTWQTIALTDAVTGESFTLGDFQGKTVFVEPMATWCSNCRKQQGEVRQAKAQLGDDVVFVGLSLETNLAPGDLASYAQGNGFDWTYAVMSVDLLEQLAGEFGRSITSAPSTPHFVIRPDRSFTSLSTGIHSAGDIVAEIQAEQG